MVTTQTHMHVVYKICHSPVAGNVVNCHPKSAKFEFQLLHFWFSFLLSLLGNQWRMAHAFGSCIHVGDLAGIPGSWLWPVLALVILTIWELNQWVEDIFLSVSLPFSLVTLPFKQTKFFRDGRSEYYNLFFQNTFNFFEFKAKTLCFTSVLLNLMTIKAETWKFFLANALNTGTVLTDLWSLQQFTHAFRQQWQVEAGRPCKCSQFFTNTWGVLLEGLSF